jgi:hypothetical protein
MWDTRAAEQNLDLRPILEEHSVEYIENDTHFIIKKCPNCNGRNKFYIDKGNKKWVCFKCVKTNDFTNKDGRGNIQTFLRDHLGYSWDQIKKLLREGEVKHYTDEDMFTRVRKEDTSTEELESIFLPSSFYRLTGEVKNIFSHREAYQYLISRKVTDVNVIEQFDLRYCHEMKRVIFPVYLDKHQIVGWQGRDVTDRWKHDQYKCNNHQCSLIYKWYFKGEEHVPEKCPECHELLEANHYPKSRNSKNFPKTELFFNQHNIDWSSPVVLVEGPFDCINVENSIALLGKVVSKRQLNILLNNRCRSIRLYLDGDEAGRLSTSQIINTLSPFVEDLQVVPLADGQDPGSFSRAANAERIMNTSMGPEEWLAAYGSGQP